MEADSNMETPDETANDEENPATAGSVVNGVKPVGLEGSPSSGEERQLQDSHPSVAESASGSTPHTVSSSIPITLRWSRLQKTVQVVESKSGLIKGSIAGKPPTVDVDTESQSSGASGPVIKTVLNQVSGYAKPRQVLALIGPSGSGKTSLLNAISGRTSFDSGVISVNGIPIGGDGSGSGGTASANSPRLSQVRQAAAGATSSLMKRFVSKVAYVKQEDIFFVHLTVRDQLAYTAFLRLPQHLPRAVKLEEVDRIIRLLRLDKVQNSQIKVLSGGEKKRVK